MAAERWLIRGGQLLCPFTGLDEPGDVLISDGRIEAVGGELPDKGAQIFEAHGLVVSPGFTDLHVHLREPGRDDEETIASGTEAALRGGYTTICCMPNTEPAIDCVSVAESVLRQAAAASRAKVRIVGAITKARRGEELAEMGLMWRHLGISAFSDDGCSVADAQLMRRGMEYIRIFDGLIISHCEEPALARGGQMHEGYFSTRLGLRGIPAAAEEVMVARDIILAELTGVRLHIAHLSTVRSVEMVRGAKERGLRVTAEVTPHHLIFRDDDLSEYSTDLKVNPPLRTEADREALRQGLADGTIDAIATDHAPHSREEKEVEFDRAAFGAIGMESAWPSLYTHIVSPGHLTLARLISALTLGPARVLETELATSGLRAGATADLVLLDCADDYRMEAAGFASLSRNCPFEGQRMKASVRATIESGELKYQREQVKKARPQGAAKKGARRATV